MRTLKFVLAAALAVALGLVAFVELAPEAATRIALDAERSRSGLVPKEVDLEVGLHYVYLEGKIFDQIRADRLEDRIRNVVAPSLIVWGRDDRAIHVDTAEVLHGMLAKSQVVILDGIGHLPMIEAPARSAADYLAFRASLG